MNRMLDDGNSLKKIRFNMKIFKEYRDVYDKKHNRIHCFYNDMFEINVERILKTMMTDVVLGCDLNFIKVLFDILIRKTRENVTLRGC